MKLKHTAALAALALGLTAVSAHADGSLNAFLGARPLKNENYWQPHDNPGGLGVMTDLSVGPELPLWVSAAGQYFQHDEGHETDLDYQSLDVGELSLGLKLMPQSGVTRPFIGAGIQRDWVQRTVARDVDDSDIARGWYAEAGAQFWIGRHFDIGLNLRWIKDTHVTLFGVPGDLDGRAYSLVAGYCWGDAPARRRHHEARD